MGIDVLKGIQVAVCCMCCTELNILGIHLPYNEKQKEWKSFYKTVTDIQIVLKIWKARKLTPKIKHETLCNDCKAGGLKSVTSQTKL